MTRQDFQQKKQRVARRLTALALFLAVLGPGIITANVDNDAGGIAVYSVAGANYGYTLLWVLIPTTLALIVIQEMCSRMGVVTSKGLADLVRENFGAKITVWFMLALVVTNATNTMAEFSGIAESGSIFGISKYIIVPICAFLVWALVLKGTYATVEKIFLVACLVYLAYPISGFLAHPHWGDVLRHTVDPVTIAGGGLFRSEYLVMVISVIGTTIAPWMQFYLQSSIVDKGTRIEQYGWGRFEVILGCLIAIIIAFFITVSCGATIYGHGAEIKTAGEAAVALRPLAGKFASWLFAIGLFNASLFAASILPLSTSLTVCEGIGWEKGVDRSFREAREFYLLYTFLIVIGAATVLMPGMTKERLLSIMVISQFLNGLLLPILLILMQRLINNEELMGKHVNSRGYNIIAWTTAIGIGLLSIILAIITLLPLLH
jgi:Mn2+/Fe2+ NRAMP family transporter